MLHVLKPGDIMTVMVEGKAGSVSIHATDPEPGGLVQLKLYCSWQTRPLLLVYPEPLSTKKEK